jgi:seryl-tRNA synthetase
MEWIYPVVALASLIAAIFAWATKLLWAKEYRDANDKTIKAKDAQIELLENVIRFHSEFASVKIRESYLSMKQQLEEYNDMLKRQIVQAQAEIEQKNRAIATHSENTDEEINNLKTEKLELERKATSLEAQLKKVREDQDRSEEILSSHLLSSPSVPEEKPSTVARYVSARLPPNTFLTDSMLYEIACMLIRNEKADAVSKFCEGTKVDENVATEILTQVNVVRFKDELLRSDRGESN